MLTYELSKCPISDISGISHSGQQSCVAGEKTAGLTNPPGHLWRDEWTALSGQVLINIFSFFTIAGEAVFQTCQAFLPDLKEDQVMRPSSPISKKIRL